MSKKGNIEAAFPLTPLQEGMLYHALRDPESGFYHGQVTFRLDTQVRPELLRRAFQRAADRHASLRTFFVWKGRDRPVQVVRQRARIPWRELDWGDKADQDVETSWERLLREDSATPFDLAVAPLTRVTLVRCGESRYRVLWSVHHAVSDGWSGSLVIREIMEDYEALAAGAEPPERMAPPSYARFVGWIESRDLEDEERYWREELASFESPTSLPFSTGRSTRRAGRTRTLVLPTETYESLKARAADMRITPATVVAGAWALLLSRYAGEEEVVFGSTVSERPPAISGIQTATGLYLNTVPVRANVERGLTPAVFLQRLQATMSHGRAHGAAGLSRIARWSGLDTQDPLFHTVVVFESFPDDVDLAAAGGFRLSHVSIDGPSDLPLGIVAVPGAGLTLELKHDPGLYDADAADRLLAQLRHVLGQLVRPDVATVDEIRLLPEDHQGMVEAWSRGPDLKREAEDVVSLFEQAADRHPEKIALRTNEAALSYGELDQAANSLAAALRERGVGEGRRVAVPASRSSRTVIAFLATLKAGAAYAPLDPDLPGVRRDKLLASFDLVLRPDPDVWPELETAPPDLEVLEVSATAGGSAERPARAPGPEAPAYVIFTSGSTGEPKGVVVTRGNLAHSNAARFDAYATSPAAFLLLSPLWVDSSVAGLFWTLTAGGTLTVPGPRAEQDPKGLSRLVQDAGITHTLMVPSLYGALLDEWGEAVAQRLSTVIMAGEATPADLVARHAASMPRVDLINEYGPSEATVWATVGDLLTGAEGGPVTIGRPVPSYSVYVMDGSQRLAGVGIEGEIVIGGPGVAEGYLGDREETSARFLPDPVRGEGRIYRTGDLGRWLDDGRLQFLGRRDQQLKIRGFRVELEEIESAIRAHPRIRDVAVAGTQGASGAGTSLTAYVVSEGSPLRDADLEPWLADRVPRYMLPDRYLSVADLPRTPAGKLDRRSLRNLDGRELGTARPRTPPRSPDEAKLAAIWREVLDLEEVGVHDDFFELGGDSLSSIRVLAQASRAGFEIDPEAFFRTPTIAELAAAPSRAAEVASGTPLGTAPLTPVQRWFFETVRDDRAHWNQDYVLSFDAGAFQSADLVRVMTALVDHHDALRTRFVFDDGGRPLHQYVQEPHEAWVRVVGAPSSDEAALAEALDTAMAEAHRSMDLEEATLFRAVAVEHEGQVRRLALISHHLIVDAVSWTVLLEDLATLVEHSRSGSDPALPSKTTPWAEWARDLAQQAEGLDGPGLVEATPPAPSGPQPCAQRGMGVGRVADGVRHTVRVPPDQVATLQQVRRRLDASMEDMLVGAFLEAWHGWCGETKLRMDLEGHGRAGGRDVHRTVGWFTSVTPFRCRLGVNARDTLRAVQRAVRRARGSGSEQSLVRFLSPDPALRAEMADRLAVEVAFNYLGGAGAHPDRFPFSVERGMTEGARGGRAQRGYALEINAMFRDGGLDVVLEGGPGSENELRALGAALQGSLLRMSGMEPGPFELDGFDDQDYSTLARLVNGHATPASEEPDKVETWAQVEDCYLLTPMQSLMLLHTEAVSQDTLVSQVEYELDGAVDRDALESAWRRAIDRHGALRTAFFSEELPGPVQVVRPHVPFQLLWSDLSPLAEDARADELDRLRTLDRRPFDLDAPPLMRVRLIRLGPARHVLVWTVHHLIMDRWSQNLLLEDVRALYVQPDSTGPELPRPPQFRSFADWARNQDPLRVAQHWGSRLRDAPEGRVFGGATDDSEGTRRSWSLRVDADETSRLRELAERSRSPLAPLVLCALSAAVARLSGRRDVMFGLTSAGRSVDLPEADRMVGSLVGNVPFRRRFSPDETLGDAVVDIGAGLLDQRYDHVAPSDLQRLSGLPPGKALFDLLVVVNLDELKSSDWGDFVLRPSAGSLDSGYPGVLSVTMESGQIGLQLVGDEGLEGQSVLDEMARSIRDLATLDPSGKLDTLLEGVTFTPTPHPPAVDRDRVRRALLEIDGVRDAVVGPSPEFAAYLVPTREADLRVGMIRRTLGEALPKAWVPKSINFLMALPRHEDGSVALDQLPPPAPPVYDMGVVPPATELEALVHRVWSQVLDIDELSVDEDFFYVGGTSIQMLQIASELEDHLGAPVPPTILLRHSTIRGMAARLGSRRTEEASDKGALVPIRAGDEGTPLFMVHGRDGGVLFARFIAKYLRTDRPVFGVQAFGGGLEGLSQITIEELASRYLADVRRFTTGPILLGGYSLGGVIAFEMARQASALGQEVESLVLLEPVLNEEPAPSPVHRLRRRVRRALRRRATPTEPLREEEGDLPEAARRELTQFRALLPPAARRYRPRPLHVPVIYYASVGEGDERRMEWEPFARGGFEMVELPAKHSHIIAEPVVGELGRDLRSRLARAEVTQG